jgi:L-lactate dehydrogenase
MHNQPTRIAVVGAGHVGATFAYSLLLAGLAPEIVLIDRDQARAEGEAMDLSHAVPFVAPARVRAGTLADCRGAAMVVITAGAGQRPGETRLDLAARNAAIIRDVVPPIVAANPDAVLLVATNPVDVLTYVALKVSGLPPARVIGSGTILDTARLRHLLSEHLEVDARSIHAYVVGEHGDTEVPVWSLANVAGMRLDEFRRAHGLSLETGVLDAIVEDTRRAAYLIIERKGATYYAVAAGLMRIVEAVLRDQSTVLSVSSLVPGFYGIEDVCLSLPSVVSREGIERVLQLDLSDDEVTALCHSADVLRGVIRDLGF